VLVKIPSLAYNSIILHKENDIPFFSTLVIRSLYAFLILPFADMSTVKERRWRVLGPLRVQINTFSGTAGFGSDFFLTLAKVQNSYIRQGNTRARREVLYSTRRPHGHASAKKQKHQAIPASTCELPACDRWSFPAQSSLGNDSLSCYHRLLSQRMSQQSMSDRIPHR
jgi:hypothetical protein